MIKKYLIVIGIIVATSFYSFSQSVTNSPYTRFGIGEIDRNGFNNSKAMGGLATGLRARNQINYLNPAALSAQDTMSFIFDLGINGVSKKLSSNDASSQFKNFSFDHIAISFPIKRWWYAGVGITPYSKIGYNIQQTEDYAPVDTANIHYDHYGTGGINQLFISNSFKVLKNLSFGVNFNYLFGSLEQYNQTYLDIPTSYENIIADKISLKKISFDLGLQYHNTISDKYFYVLGISYSNKTNFNSVKKSAVLMTENFSTNGGMNVVDYLANYTYDTIASSIDYNYKVEVPARYSIGFSAGIEYKLMFGFDYSYQDWSNIESLNINNNFGIDESFNFGVEYIPNIYSLRNYYKKVSYRAGFYYNDSYLEFNGNQVNNYGITFGLGFPINNYRTSLNFSCSIGKKGTTNNGLIEENYTLFGINLTLYDFWFIKRKFQ